MAVIVIAYVNLGGVESADAVVSFIFNNDYGNDDLKCNRESATLAISEINLLLIINFNLNHNLQWNGQCLALTTKATSVPFPGNWRD